MTIDELCNSAPSVLDRLPIEVLAGMQDAADKALADAQKVQAILHGILARRYAAGLNQAGTHHRQDGGYDIKVTVPKTVTWDQERLSDAVATIRDEWGSDPAEYVETKLSVQERKYAAWPAAIRELFTPARTVKAGKPKFEITPADAGEAREAA